MTQDTVPPADLAHPNLAPQSPPEGAGRVVAPDDLAPSLIVPPEDEAFLFWVGVIPSCPQGAVHVAGICFPKQVEDVSRGSTGKTIRIPRIGDVLALTRSRLDLIARKLPSKVFRMLGSPAPEQGAGEVRDRVYDRPGAAVLLTIPDEAETAALLKRGRRVHPFVAAVNDRPLSEFVFMIPVPGGTRTAEVAPEPLSVTGLQYPAEDATPAPNTSKAVAGPGVRG